MQEDKTATDELGEDIAFDSETDVPEADDTDDVEEPATDDSAQDDPQPEETDGDGDDAGDDKIEAYESEEEFLAQYNLPGGPKTLEEAMTMTQELVRKLNQRQETDAISERTPPQTPQAPPAESGGYFKRGMIASDIKAQIESGAVAKEHVPFAQSWSGIIDRAIDSHVGQIEKAFNAMALNLNQVTEKARNDSWRRVQKTYPKLRSLVTREDLDKVALQMGTLDYEEALRWKASGDPRLMSEFARNERDRGANQERNRGKKRLKKFAPQRRGKPIQTSSAPYANFLDAGGGLDNAKLDALNDPSGKKKSKVVDAYVADMKKGKIK